MKQIILATTAMLMMNSAYADVIKCRFTEPSINTTYSTTQSTLTYDEDGAVTQVLKNVSFQIKAAGVFELLSREGKVLQTLILNNQGSDGMSDRIYPYEAQLHEISDAVNLGVGGCTSNYLKAENN